MPFLERYGVYLTSDRRQVDYVNPEITLRGVTGALEDYFGFRSHTPKLFLLQSEEELAFLRHVLALKDLPEADIDRIVPLIQKDGAVTVYLHDEENLRYPCDYAIFVGDVPALEFPRTVGEEVTHGEHACIAKIDHRMSKGEYDSAFHELTQEFVAYLGSIAVLRLAGFQAAYLDTVSLHRPIDQLTESDIAHLVAYGAVDAMVAQEFNFPAQALMRASTNQNFWAQMSRANHNVPVQIGFIVPEALSLQSVQKTIDTLIDEAGAEGVIKATAYHSEEAQ